MPYISGTVWAPNNQAGRMRYARIVIMICDIHLNIVSFTINIILSIIIIIIDEPTTGMDPKIRRNIWNMIIQKKTDRVTIMTTHSMEEADILGDTIAIMANGQLRYNR